MKQRILSYIYIVLLLFGFYACVQEEAMKPEVPVLDVSWSDSLIQEIATKAEFQRYSEITKALSSKQPNEQWAALVFMQGMNPKDIPVESLDSLMKSQEQEIRELAIRTLGQSHQNKAAVALTNQFNGEEESKKLAYENALILEAIGKTGDEKLARYIATTETYTPRDSILVLGQMRALYQFALRNIQPQEAKDLMIEIVGNDLYPSSVRHIAADYLDRFEVKIPKVKTYAMAKSFEQSKDPYFIIEICDIVEEINSIEASTLVSKYKEINHRNARLAILNALSKKRYNSSAASLCKSIIKEEDDVLAAAAAHYFVALGREEDAVEYRNLAERKSTNPIASIILFGASIEHLPFYYQLSKTTIKSILKRKYNQEESDLIKFEIIKQLYLHANDAAFLEQKFVKASPELKLMLVDFLESQVGTIKNERWNRKQARIFNFLNQQLQESKIGVRSAILYIFSNYANLIPQSWVSENWRTDYQELQMPQDFETAFFYEKIFDTQSIEYKKKPRIQHFKKMDFNRLQNWSDSSRLQVQTNKGTIEIELFTRHQPFTASVFLSLVEKNFYNGKKWHRVIPNFVSQTGAPRGDGFGSGDFIIPSECSMHHYTDPGMVGVASLGRNTESTQWFITQKPTPHLDGRYTIFGKVTKGLDIVQKLNEQDVIESIKVK